MINEPVHPYAIAILNVYVANNRAAKHMNAKLA